MIFQCYVIEYSLCSKCTYWLLLSNQSFFGQIAGYVMSVDDHRIG